LSPVLVIGVAVALALSLVAFLPRVAVRLAQDRLARKLLSEKQQAPLLLTRADLTAGKWRRVPGVLGLAAGSLSFSGLFGERLRIATPDIAKIATGRRLASGRLLFRSEVLRIWRRSGEEVEFVLEAASASAWRSHLGLWAMEERVRDAAPPASAEQVVPGRS
jgi:hypothetical protein